MFLFKRPTPPKDPFRSIRDAVLESIPSEDAASIIASFLECVSRLDFFRAVTDGNVYVVEHGLHWMPWPDAGAAGVGDDRGSIIGDINDDVLDENSGDELSEGVELRKRAIFLEGDDQAALVLAIEHRRCRVIELILMHARRHQQLHRLLRGFSQARLEFSQNGCDHENVTPLHFACRLKKRVSLIATRNSTYERMSARASFQKTNRGVDQQLTMGVEARIVQLLIDSKSDINAYTMSTPEKKQIRYKAAGGIRPLDVALNSNNTEIIELLRLHGAEEGRGPTELYTQWENPIEAEERWAKVLDDRW
eukprot:CAMPEP_0114507156 /NCGR_PEP_ID=MMETSP0109-20121206/11853_1 /TAXON_ID=29199 /ORGANISM="Chlorarachnion reptans, Strain CCCM449" /LENGTH=306 /DNA_ID=CAMNT_0001685877 /DNA_START=398 /DNA_END=1315 /DNA_ORIENTATION=+